MSKSKAKSKAASRAKVAATKPAPAKTKTKPPQSPSENASKTIFDNVEKLVAAKKLTKSAAFRLVGKETGRSEDAVSNLYYYHAKHHGGTKSSAPRGGKVAAAAPSPLPGKVSQTTFQRVEQLIAKGKLSKAAAFQRIAKETGKQPGTVSAAYYFATRKQGARAKAQPVGRAAVIGGKRNVGQETFAQVERMVHAENISRAEAFRRIAKATGRKVGTISVSYYSMARKGGEKPSARSGHPVKMSRNGTGSVDQILQQLGSVLRGQEEELARLRAENARYAQVRQLMMGK